MNKLLKNPVFILCTLLFFISIWLSNRAFMVGYASSLIFLFLLFKGFQTSWRTLGILLAVLISLIILLAIFYKSDSSSGRLLIYKVSFNILEKNFWTGVGIGKFQIVYGNYQADYFRTGHYTNQELLLADNTYYAFNDYFQLVIEWGVAGLIFLLLYSGIIIQLFKRAFSRNKKNFLLTLAASQFLAISVAACFTHLMEKLLFECALITCILILIYFAFDFKIRKVYIIAAVLVVNLSILYLEKGGYIFNYSKYQEWENSNILYSIGSRIEALNKYRALYPVLKKDPEFLISYADLLWDNKQPAQALAIYESAALKRTSNQLLLNLGNCYYALNNLSKADSAYLQSVFMVPNRFSNRQKLFDFYYDTKQEKKAIYWGRSILDLPVKVPSRKVDFIRQKVTEKLSGLIQAL